MNQTAVTILSGGLDSTVATAVSLAVVPGIVAAVTFRYGQKHEEAEVAAARRVVDHFRIHFHHVLDLPRPVSASALVDSQVLIPEGRDLTDVRPDADGETLKEIAPTFVPGRNLVFIAQALDVLWRYKASALVMGVNWMDSSGYPDCRRSFITAAQHAAQLALGQAITDNIRLTILTPLIDHSKADIVRLGIQYHAPLHLTWSCYHGREQACGVCDSCQLRISGFRQAKVVDPIEYEVGIDWGDCTRMSWPLR
jgi:7-cyano-7-deazaguanine synthase